MCHVRVPPGVIRTCHHSDERLREEAMYHARTAFNADINVTPMIDVLLVLMIVFMLAQFRTRPVMDVTVPAPAVGGAPGPTIVLELTSDGGYRLNGSPVSRDALD